MGQDTDPLNVVVAVDEWKNAGSGQVPLIGLVAVKVLNQNWCLMGSNGERVLVVGDYAERYCRPALWK